MQFDVIIIGAGPGGIFTAYELTRLRPELKVGVFEAGHPLNRRRCPIDRCVYYLEKSIRRKGPSCGNKKK